MEGRDAEITVSVEYEVWDLGVDHQAGQNPDNLRKINIRTGYEIEELAKNKVKDRQIMVNLVILSKTEDFPM